MPNKEEWTVTVNQLPGFLWGLSPKGKRVRKTILSLNSRAHWRQRQICMKLDRERVFSAAHGMPLTMPWDRVEISVTLYAKKLHHSKDWEQTIARMKGYIDGLRDCGAITDDTMKNIVAYNTQWVEVPEEQERTEIKIVRLEESWNRK